MTLPTPNPTDNFGSMPNAAPPKLEIPERVFIDRDLPETTDKSNEEIANSQLDKLPVPTGYRILIVPYRLPRASKGGIYIPEATLRNEELAAVIGYVIALGPDAYSDPLKFPHGPWCKIGDYVVFGRYAGARVTMQDEGNENLSVRLLNDDEVLAVVSNPADYVGVR